MNWNPLKSVRRKTTMIIILFMTSSLFSYGQDKVLSLDDAINIAIRNNKILNAYTLKVEEQKALKPTAFTIEKTDIFYEYDENNIAANNHPLNIFGIEQNFSFPTVYSAQNRVNKQNINIAETQLRKQTQILIKNVSQAYYQINTFQNKQKI